MWMTALRGHGTRVADGRLLATVCGTVERVNKLVSVRPLRTRYVPETGDVVLGRVVDIAGKRWKLDAGGRQDAIQLGTAVHLPGGAQRRRNTVDELNMRALYAENDLISCEAQSFYADGADCAAHAQSEIRPARERAAGPRAADAGEARQAALPRRGPRGGVRGRRRTPASRRRKRRLREKNENL